MRSITVDVLLMGLAEALVLLLVGWCCVALGREIRQSRYRLDQSSQPTPPRWRVAFEEETTRRGLARAIGALILVIFGKDVPPEDLYLVISGIMAAFGIWQVVRADR